MIEDKRPLSKWEWIEEVCKELRLEALENDRLKYKERGRGNNPF